MKPAAIHEAAHAAYAMQSNWLILEGPISVTSNSGKGESFIRLNNEAIMASIRENEDWDADIATIDLVVALMCGAAAEKIYSSSIGITPTTGIIDGSQSDYDLAQKELVMVRQDRNIETYEEKAKHFVSEDINWKIIIAIASELDRLNSLTANECLAIVEKLHKDAENKMNEEGKDNAQFQKYTCEDCPKFTPGKLAILFSYLSNYKYQKKLSQLQSGTGSLASFDDCIKRLAVSRDHTNGILFGKFLMFVWLGGQLLFCALYLCFVQFLQHSQGALVNIANHRITIVIISILWGSFFMFPLGDYADAVLNCLRRHNISVYSNGRGKILIVREMQGKLEYEEIALPLF